MPDRRDSLRHDVGLVVFLALLVAVWQAAYSARLLPGYAFPSPLAVGRRLVELARDGSLGASAKASLVRMVLGFSLSAALGLAIGVSMGVSHLAGRLLKSLFLGVQTLPSVAWVPIALLLFGLSDAAIYFVIVMSSTAAMAIATADGIANTPPGYVRAARTLGVSGVAMGYRVVLPAALPQVVAGIKLGWTLGWHGVVSAELLKSSIGLGFLLYMGRELNDAAQVVGIMIVTVGIGLLVDRFVFGWVERSIRTRWGLER
jgi:NitT/TauT family transport system permease protein